MGELSGDRSASGVPGAEQLARLPGPAVVILAFSAVGALAGMLTLPLRAAAMAVALFGVTGTAAVVIGDRWSRRHPPRQVPLWQSPPSTAFHLALAGPAVVVLVASSVPAGSFLPLALAWSALVAGAVVWVCRVAAYLLACLRRTAHGTPLWLPVAPLAGAAVAVLLVVDAPLRARWMASRTAFETAVASGELEEGRVGLFEIESVDRDGDAVIFQETHTGAFTTGGFAYLPDGPLPPTQLGEWSEFRHLGGHWYVWRARW